MLAWPGNGKSSEIDLRQVVNAVPYEATYRMRRKSKYVKGPKRPVMRSQWAARRLANVRVPRSIDEQSLSASVVYDGRRLCVFVPQSVCL